MDKCDRMFICKKDQDVRENKGTVWIYACMVTEWWVNVLWQDQKQSLL